MYKFGEASLKKAEGVNPILLDCASRALAKSNYDMTIPWRGGVRTAEQQQELFNAGNSKCDGYKKKSYHQSGHALDVIPVGVAPYTKTKEFNHFAQKMLETWQEMIYQGSAKGLLVWGGTWGDNGWDKPHWEIRGL